MNNRDKSFGEDQESENRKKNKKNKGLSYDDIRNELNKDEPSVQNNSSSGKNVKEEYSIGSSGRRRKKVYKKKRRSYQPSDRIKDINSKRRRKILLLTSLFLLPIFCILGFLYYKVVIFVESKDFAKNLSRHFSNKTGLNVHVSSLKLGQKWITSNFVEIDGFSNNDIDRLSFYKTHVAIKPLNYFRETWEFSNISTENTKIYIKDFTKLNLSNLSGQLKNTFNELFAQKVNYAGIGLSNSPSDILIGKFTFYDLEVIHNENKILSGATLYSSFGDSGNLIKDGKVNLDLFKDNYVFKSATINYGKIKGLEINKVKLSVSDDHVEFKDGVFNIINEEDDSSKHVGNFNGKAFFQNSELSSIKLNFENFYFSLKNWLSKDLVKNIDGYVISDLKTNYDAKNKSYVINSKISSGYLKVENTSAQKEMVAFSDIVKLNNVDFNTVKLRIESKSGGQTNIFLDEVVSQSLLKLTGFAKLRENGELSGDINIGISAGAVATANQNFKELANLVGKKEDNWVWFTSKLSGDLNNINLNFAENLLDKMKEVSIDDSVKTLENLDLKDLKKINEIKIKPDSLEQITKKLKNISKDDLNELKELKDILIDKFNLKNN